MRMINESYQDKLNSGENLLWAHTINDDASPLENASYIEPCWLKFLFLPFILLPMVLQYRRNPQSFLAELFPEILVWLAIGLAVLVLSKTVLASRLKAKAERLIFQNILITDQRVITFNHNPSRQVTVNWDRIANVEPDFENGGRALRVESEDHAKDLIVIGNTDFHPAASIAAKRLQRT